MDFVVLHALCKHCITSGVVVLGEVILCMHRSSNSTGGLFAVPVEASNVLHYCFRSYHIGVANDDTYQILLLVQSKLSSIRQNDFTI